MISMTDKQFRQMLKASQESALAIRELSAQVRELIAINQDLLAIVVDQLDDVQSGDELPAIDSMLLD